MPFCDSKCFYCSFNSYVDKFHLKSHYMEVLTRELEHELQILKNNNQKLSTIFIGGGTPSSINYASYAQMFKLLKGYINDTTEVTIEANPNSATIDWLKAMKDYGVNRVSFGVQSFNDTKLSFLGRSHNSKRAIKAIQDAQCIGFNSINCDIIYACANDTKELISSDLDMANKLGVEHISSYSLTLEAGTKFWTMKDVSIDDEELSEFVINYLKSLGYHQYEISNFAKNNKFESKHNKGYWEYKEYLGVGCGAVGRIGSNRYYSLSDIESYLRNPLHKEIEILEEKDMKIEKILLGLRSNVGFDLSLLDVNNVEKAHYLEKLGKIKIENSKIYNKNYLLADEIALYLS
ncbi:coproporphyrinogen III oxidase family protein [Arcobacter sp. FWKO B]|nr:coproporphyrinogen III oxidase family protein [Arcobacter sp. FWKO B]